MDDSSLLPDTASGNWNESGDWDANEPPFDEDELEWAVAFRQRIRPDARLTRKDQCPHTPMCSSLATCVQFIAWYKRHRYGKDRE